MCLPCFYKKKCSICFNKIFTNYLICIRCNIYLHEKCYKPYQHDNYTKCPYCNQVGCIGIGLVK